MRLAYFSPLGPQRSGISDYSEELLPHLAAAGADIDLFVDGFEPSSAEIAARFRRSRLPPRPRRARAPRRIRRRRLPPRQRPPLSRRRSYDAMRAHPGVVVFHDFALQDFFLGLARERGDMRVYLDEVAAVPRRRRRGARPRRRSRAARLPAALRARRSDFPLNCRLARGAEGIIVHSDCRAARASRQSRRASPVAASTTTSPRRPPAASRPRARRRRRRRAPGASSPPSASSRPARASSARCARSPRSRDAYDFRYTLVGETEPLLRRARARPRARPRRPRRDHGPRHARRVRAAHRGDRRGAQPARAHRRRDFGEPLPHHGRGRRGRRLRRRLVRASCPTTAVVKVDAGAHADADAARLPRTAASRTPTCARASARTRAATSSPSTTSSGAPTATSHFIREVVAGRARRRFVARRLDGDLARSASTPDGDDALVRGGRRRGRRARARARLLRRRDDAPRARSRHVARLSRHARRSSHSFESEGATIERRGSARRVERNSARRRSRRTRRRRSNGPSHTPGRSRKVEGVDYKRAAVEYPRKHRRRSATTTSAPSPSTTSPTSRRALRGRRAWTPTRIRHFCDFANIAVALALPPGRRLLDVGCGSGWLSEYFARLGYDVTGIDISPDLIEIARERVARVPYGVDHETPLRCRFLVHDAEGGAARRDSSTPSSATTRSTTSRTSAPSCATSPR